MSLCCDGRRGSGALDSVQLLHLHKQHDQPGLGSASSEKVFSSGPTSQHCMGAGRECTIQQAVKLLQPVLLRLPLRCCIPDAGQ